MTAFAASFHLGFIYHLSVFFSHSQLLSRDKNPILPILQADFKLNFKKALLPIDYSVQPLESLIQLQYQEL